jgi:hypothetical protein
MARCLNKHRNISTINFNLTGAKINSRIAINENTSRADLGLNGNLSLSENISVMKIYN